MHTNMDANLRCYCVVSALPHKIQLVTLLEVYTGKLSLVDLAGSERASETNNIGRQLKDGANINR